MPDQFRPTSRDVVGRVWVHSGQGHWLKTGLRWVVTPWLWAVFGTALAFLITWRVLAGPGPESGDVDTPNP